MNDTHPSIEAYYLKLLSEKSGQERLKMGCSMFELSKKLVISNIRAQFGDLSPNELRREIFLRFYADDYDTKTRQKIISYLTNT